MVTLSWGMEVDEAAGRDVEEVWHAERAGGTP